MSSQPETFQRFSLGERVLHVLLFSSFTILALTGLPQKYSSLEWARGLADLLGGVYSLRLIHRASALVLAVGFAYYVGRGLYRLWVQRGRSDMMPRVQDFRDLVHNIAFFLRLRSARPRFDRFNYIEKLEFWTMMAGMMIMGLTGFTMWLPTLVARFLPGVAVPFAKAAHGGEALLAVSTIILWHLYNAHLNPRIFPFNWSIFTGQISKHEMMLEHPAEYERRTGKAVTEELLSDRPSVNRRVLAVSTLLGIVFVGLYVLFLVWAINPPSPRLLATMNGPIPRDRLTAPAPTPAIPAGPSDPGKSLWRDSDAGAPAAIFKAVVAAGDGTADGAQALQFTDLSGGEIATWRWDFGDGSTSAERNPRHAFTQCPGRLEQCSVSLTVCGPGGCDTSTKVGYVCLSAECATQWTSLP